MTPIVHNVRQGAPPFDVACEHVVDKVKARLCRETALLDARDGGHLEGVPRGARDNWRDGVSHVHKLDHGIAVDVAKRGKACVRHRPGQDLQGKRRLVEVRERHGTLLSGKRHEVGLREVCRQGVIGRERSHGKLANRQPEVLSKPSGG